MRSPCCKARSRRCTARSMPCNKYGILEVVERRGEKGADGRRFSETTVDQHLTEERRQPCRRGEETLQTRIRSGNGPLHDGGLSLVILSVYVQVCRLVLAPPASDSGGVFPRLENDSPPPRQARGFYGFFSPRYLHPPDDRHDIALLPYTVGDHTAPQHVRHGLPD